MHDFTRRAAGAAGGALIAMGVALGLASLWARPQQPPSQPASAAVLTETFVRIAVAADPFPLRTWRNEVRMLVIGEQADELRPLVERAAESFAAWTGVDTMVVSAPEQGFNVLIESMPRVEYARGVAEMGGGGEAGQYLEEHLVCYSTGLSRADSAALLRATVAIPDDLDPKERERCVWHELMHVFGIFGHPDQRVPSVLARATTPTAGDILFVRTLYDPRLADLRAADAAARVRAVIDALLDEPDPTSNMAARGN